NVTDALEGIHSRQGQEEEENTWPMTSTHQLYADNKRLKVKQGVEGALSSTNKKQSGFGNTQKSAIKRSNAEYGFAIQSKALTSEVEAAFVGEFPVFLLAFNSQNEKGRLDLMVKMIH
ncbi:MAG: hypothetical protein EZS28_053227, partial [Streblomastix strix]